MDVAALPRLSGHLDYHNRRFLTTEITALVHPGCVLLHVLLGDILTHKL